MGHDAEDGELMLTNGQKRALHAAAREAGIDDADRRMIQWNVGGFHSAADRTASRYGFVCVMAFIEARCGGQLRGNTPGYWQAARDGSSESSAMEYAIRADARRLGWSDADVDAFVASTHMTSGAFGELAGLPPYWLARVRQALIEISRREARNTA